MRVLSFRQPVSSFRRLFGIILLLALFLGGETAARAHDHDHPKPVDGYCALCLLGAAAGGMATASDWHIPVLPVLAVFAALLIIPARRKAVRFCNSQGPPARLKARV